MDRITKEQRSNNMKRIRNKDTSIERILRKALWDVGVRYRKNWSALPGKPDIVITKYKIAIFCDSAFWHGKDYESSTKPKTNAEFWDRKIRRNIERDKEVNAQLSQLGWSVLRFWDKDIINNTDSCVRIILDQMRFL